MKTDLLRTLLFVSILSFIGCQSNVQETASEPEVRILPPEELYEELFYDVQMRTDLFPDSKTFVDCIPTSPIDEILSGYENLENKEDTEVMKSFLEANFKIPGSDAGIEVAESSNAPEHIKKLWGFLERPADQVNSGTLFPLPNAYVVPGGRFREVYYWDSYFTMLGLQVDGKVDLIDNVIQNFSFLIDSIGFIPNGNRTYYDSRSQPPFYSLMVKLHVEENKTRTLNEYLPYLLGEYDFWMKGAETVSKGDQEGRVVSLEGGILNRYWDNKAEPRAESYKEDIETTEEAIKENPDLKKEKSYRHLRAGAESGWDYSTRWFDIKEEGQFHLSSIHTTDIIPVDLNSLMYHLEMTISEAYMASGDQDAQAQWEEKANQRKSLILQYCWNGELGFFMDFDFVKGEQTPVMSLAGMYPLFFGLATDDQAKAVSKVIEGNFLKPGGVVTTLNNSGQQWDYPNGWAPLQWMTVKGLINYDENELANEIADRWLSLNDRVFENTGKMTEKYNVVDITLEGGGGEYPNQDGFGWTNGVYQKLNSMKE